MTTTTAMIIGGLIGFAWFAFDKYREHKRTLYVSKVDVKNKTVTLSHKKPGQK